MRKKLLVLIILFGTTKIIYGQFDYINEKYNVSAEASMDEKSDEEVRFATEEFIYTASNFAKLGGEYIAKYKRSDYSLVWRTKLPKSWKFDGSKLYAKTIEFHKDGSCVILAKGKRTKSVSTKVAIVHYNSNGELDHIQPLDDEMNEQFEGADAKLIVDKNNYFVILLGYGRSEKADKLICYTYSSDWKLTSKTSAISDGNNDIVDVEYNPVTSAMYVLLADQRVIPTSSNSHMSTYVITYKCELFKLDLRSSITFSKKVNPESGWFSSCTLAFNPNDRSVIVTGFAQSEDAKSIEGIMIAKMDGETLTIINSRLYSNLEELGLQQKIAKEKYYKGNADNKVNLNFVKWHITKSNQLVTVYEDYTYPTHHGHVVLVFENDLELTKQLYVADYGWMRSGYFIENDKLRIRSAVQAGFIQIRFPEQTQFEDYENSSHAVIEILIDPSNTNEPRCEVICSADRKESSMYFYFFDLAKTPAGKKEWFVTCNTNGMTSTSNRRFIEISKKTTD